MTLVFSGIIMLPAIAWGASAVKTLGGAGTYTGVTSVGSGATGTKTGTRVLRAGSVRTAPAVKAVSTTTTFNNNTGTVVKSDTVKTSGDGQNRMSIGKYLSGVSGGTAISSGSSSSGAKTSELEKDVQDLYDKLEDLEKAGYIAERDIDTIIENYLKNADLDLDGYVTENELNDYVKSDAIKDFLTADDLSGYVKSDAIQNFLTASDLNGYVKSTELNLDNYLTSEDLTGLVTSDTLNTSLDGYVKADELGTQVASQVTSELADRDLVTSSDLNDYVKSTELNLDSYLVNDVENPYVQQSALDGYLTDADLTDKGFLTDAALAEKGYLTDADLDLDKYLVNDATNPYIQQSALEGYLVEDETNPYVKTNDLGTQVANKVTSELEERDLVTSSDLAGFLTDDETNPYVKTNDLTGFLTDDTENPYIQQSSLNNYVQNDTLNQLAYRSYVDTIVNNLNTTQADVNSLSQQVQNIQVSNMPEVPACSDGSCTYMLLDNGGEAKTWKQMSVVDEFDATKMN